MTPNYIFITSRAPQIKLPDRHLKIECNVLHSNVDFILNSTNIQNSIFFDSPRSNSNEVLFFNNVNHHWFSDVKSGAATFSKHLIAEMFFLSTASEHLVNYNDFQLSMS